MKLPQILLESLQGQLQAEGRKLCKEIAKLLDIPEKELVTNVLLKQPKMEIACTDETERTSCPVFVKRRTILERCRYPCILGTNRCTTHQSIQTIEEPETGIGLYRLAYSSDEYSSLWIDQDTQLVYSDTNSIVGRYVNGILTLFD